MMAVTSHVMWVGGEGVRDDDRTSAGLRGKVNLEQKQTFHLINVPKDSFHHVKEHLLIYCKIVKLVKFEKKKSKRVR